MREDYWGEWGQGRARSVCVNSMGSLISSGSVGIFPGQSVEFVQQWSHGLSQVLRDRVVVDNQLSTSLSGSLITSCKLL